MSSASSDRKHAQCSRCYGILATTKTKTKTKKKSTKAKTTNVQKNENITDKICKKCIDFANANKKLLTIKDKINHNKIKVIKNCDLNKDLQLQFNNEMNGILDSISNYICRDFNNLNQKIKIDFEFIQSLWKIILKYTYTDGDIILLFLDCKNISNISNNNSNNNDHDDIDDNNNSNDSNDVCVVNRERLVKLLNIAQQLASYSKQKQNLYNKPNNNIHLTKFEITQLVSITIKNAKIIENIFDKSKILRQNTSSSGKVKHGKKAFKQRLITNRLNNDNYVLNKYFEFYLTLLLHCVETCDNNKMKQSEKMDISKTNFEEYSFDICDWCYDANRFYQGHPPQARHSDSYFFYQIDNCNFIYGFCHSQNHKIAM